MTNSHSTIIAEIEHIWNDHIHDVFVFPSNETLERFFVEGGWDRTTVREAIVMWWDVSHLTNLS